MSDEPIYKACREWERTRTAVAEDAEEAKAGDCRVAVHRRYNILVGGHPRQRVVNDWPKTGKLLPRDVDPLKEGALCQ